jgi:hypothetical protein
MRSLGDMARDAIRSPEYDVCQKRGIAIEVRDGSGPVLHARLTVEVEITGRRGF